MVARINTVCLYRILVRLEKAFRSNDLLMIQCAKMIEENSTNPKLDCVNEWLVSNLNAYLTTEETKCVVKYVKLMASEDLARQQGFVSLLPPPQGHYEKWSTRIQIQIEADNASRFPEVKVQREANNASRFPKVGSAINSRDNSRNNSRASTPEVSSNALIMENLRSGSHSSIVISRRMSSSYDSYLDQDDTSLDLLAIRPRRRVVSKLEPIVHELTSKQKSDHLLRNEVFKILGVY
jgi:hypothetical protein